MKFKFKISKLANQFFFISTLAKWHYSSRKEDREKWLRITGKLSPKEEKALVSFEHLMKTKYGFQSPEKYLGEIFYKYENSTAWKKLKQSAGENDCALIRKIFLVFRKKFELAWEKEHNARLKVIKNALRNKKTVDFLDAVTLTFGGKTSKINQMVLVILFSPCNGDFTAAGSSNLTGNFITLELPDLKENTWQLSYSIALLGHEIGHLYFKKREGKKMITQIIKTLLLKKQYNTLPFGTLTIINEAITSAFVPMGALGQKYFSDTIADILFSNLSQGVAAEQSLRKGKLVSYYSNLEMYFIWKLFPTTRQYLREKKPIDKNFIMEVGFLLKELIK